MTDDDKPVEALLGELPTISVPSLNVNVDFNELLRDEGEPRVWELLGALKDLLGERE